MTPNTLIQIMFPTFTPAPEMTPTTPDQQVFFVPYSDCKTKVLSITWKFPYHKITKAGEEFGFFVATKTCPAAPAALKNRQWGYKRAQYNGLNGYYVYVKQFTNNFNVEEYVYVSVND